VRLAQAPPDRKHCGQARLLGRACLAGVVGRRRVRDRSARTARSAFGCREIVNAATLPRSASGTGSPRRSSCRPTRRSGPGRTTIRSRNEPGDSLVFLSDGMLERDATAVDVHSVLTACQHMHARETVQELTRAVVEACGGDLRDDATVLCFDWHGGSKRDRDARGRRGRAPVARSRAARGGRGVRFRRRVANSGERPCDAPAAVVPSLRLRPAPALGTEPRSSAGRSNALRGRGQSARDGNAPRPRAGRRWARSILGLVRPRRIRCRLLIRCSELPRRFRCSRQLPSLDERPLAVSLRRRGLSLVGQVARCSCRAASFLLSALSCSVST
jgi:hypothetical protein